MRRGSSSCSGDEKFKPQAGSVYLPGQKSEAAVAAIIAVQPWDKRRCYLRPATYGADVKESCAVMGLKLKHLIP